MARIKHTARAVSNSNQLPKEQENPKMVKDMTVRPQGKRVKLQGKNFPQNNVENRDLTFLRNHDVIALEPSHFGRSVVTKKPRSCSSAGILLVAWFTS